MSEAVLVDKIERSIVIRFARPEIRSPLSIVVLERLERILDEIDASTEIERVIFTGVHGVFASGADLREIAQVDGNGAKEFGERGQRLMNRIAGLDAETIAAVNGVCFGGALDLALACKRRLASPAAVFSHPGSGLGIITGWGGTQRLPRLVGEAIALEMFFTGKRVSAGEALQYGLVEIVTADPLAAALEF